ncbi:MAG: energy transducer TonB [Roseomonas sp.]|nr:energy transducer TonB [Roseomonas sp.]MCA3291469.1 energy transducer TonB [Roseomonas sp.]MCA3296225.1 energy transducer TonB [Roseomonas sp.]
MRLVRRGFGIGASLVLHGLVAALLFLWPAIEEYSSDHAADQGIAVVYEGAPEIGMAESPAAPPEVAAVLPAPEVPPPPPMVAAPAPPPPPPQPVMAAAPPPPAPPPPAALAAPILPPPPLEETPPQIAEAQPQPEPAPEPEQPRQVAEVPPPAPERRPPARASAAQPSPQPVRLNAGLQGMESFTLEGRTTPPEAADAARNRRPPYPESSRRRGEEGVVRVELLVDPNGRVADVRILESSGFGTLDAAAVQAVRDWRFRPAQRAGVPVAGSITTAVHFRLETARR